MHNVLSLIVESRKRRIEVLRKNREELLMFIKKAPRTLSFKDAIQRKDKLSLIAEVKQASPSAGVLRKSFCALDIARMYQQCNANAISVVTEEEFFLGNISYLRDIKKDIGLPILRKDFILDEIQVYESRAAGADAVLLIVRLLEDEKLRKLYSLSRDLGLDVLVEIHTEKELRKAITLGARIIGINNRNLNTLKIDLNCTKKLMPFIPVDLVKVSESGIATLKDMLWLKGLGVDAALIGETFMKADDIEAKVKELHIDA